MVVGGLLNPKDLTAAAPKALTQYFRMKKSWESLWHNKFFFQNSNFLHRGVQKSKMKEEILELSPILTLFRPLGMCFTFVNNCYGLCDKTTQCRSSCFLSLARKPHLPNVHFNPNSNFENFDDLNIDICCLDWIQPSPSRNANYAMQ